jgi:predicted Zn-dependent protease
LNYSLGLGFFKSSRNPEARKAFEAELRRNPKDVSTLCYLAYLDEMEGNLYEGSKRAELALASDPDSAEANALLGKILLKQGKAAEALKPLEAAAAKDPTDSDKHYQLARAYQQLGRRAEAAQQFAEVERLKKEGFEKDQNTVQKQPPP